MIAERLPDFFIVGAMKAGTTSLHVMLNGHPDVFIPSVEIGFFDHDDFFQHVDNFLDPQRHWVARNYERNLAADLLWYKGLFAEALPRQTIGSDSTTYLHSRYAAERIAKIIPQAKLIVMLRDPVARAWSQYWHMLNAGQVLFGFDDALRLMPERILSRSCYVDGIRRLLDNFPQEQLHVILFEEFIEDPISSLRQCLDFMGVSMVGYLPTEALWHKNSAQYPRFPRLQQWLNRLRWRQQLLRTVKTPSVHGKGMDGNLSQAPQSPMGKVFRKINASGGQAPSISPHTRQVLNDILQAENRDLPELLKRNLDDLWYR